MPKPSKQKILKDLIHDYKAAVRAKVLIDRKIIEWNDLYDAKPQGNEVKNRSQIVMKEVAKQIEWAKPNVTMPFTATSQPVRITGGMSENRRGKAQKFLNDQFTGPFNRAEFMSDLVDVCHREGTAWIHTSWKREEIVTKERFRDMTIEGVMALSDKDPDHIEMDYDGTYQGYFVKTKRIVNRPHAEVLRNEHCFPDPSARNENEMTFFIQEKLMTGSELKKLGVKTEDIARAIEKASEYEDSSLGTQRNIDNRDYGQDQTYIAADDARKKFPVLIYWGYYDIDGDGIVEPIKVMWTKRDSTLLSIEENPMPSKQIPFRRAVYGARPFSLWGNAMAHYIGDNQRVKTGLVRGMLDNLSNSNAGTKYVLRGAMDYTNMKRMKDGEKFVIINKPDAVADAQYTPLPADIFNLYQAFELDTKQLSGLSGEGMALSQKQLGENDDMPMTMSQQRMAGMVMSIAATVGWMMKEWLEMSEQFLDDEQILELFAPGEQVDINVFHDVYKANCNMVVGTEVAKSKKLRELNLLMQQSKTLGEKTPPETLSQLTAEMFELFDMPDKAAELRNYKPEPSPMDQMMMQLQMQEKQLELEERASAIRVAENKAQTDLVKAQAAMYESMANIPYKDAQTKEKLAKAQQTSMETAMRPVEMMNATMKENQTTGEQ